MRNITLKQIRAFIEVVNLKSFTQAAARLNISQPALTTAIKNLEAEIGVKLLERTSRHVEPSVVGRIFAERCLALTNELHQSIEYVRMMEGKSSNPRIAVGSISSVCDNIMPQALSAFVEKNPRVNVELSALRSLKVIELLMTGGIDFGIAFAHDDFDGYAETLALEPFGVIARPDHPLMDGRPLTWRRLEQYESLNLGFGDQILGSRPDFDLGRVRWSGAEYRVRSVYYIIDMILSKNALAVVPVSFIPPALMANLSFKALEDPVIERRIAFMFRKDYKPNVYCSELIECIQGAARAVYSV